MDNIPNEFKCPVTLKIMANPIICNDGYTYDSSSIMNLMDNLSPLTRQPIDKNNLIPNIKLKKEIDNYIKQKNNNIITNYNYYYNNDEDNFFNNLKFYWYFMSNKIFKNNNNNKNKSNIQNYLKYYFYFNNNFINKRNKIMKRIFNFGSCYIVFIISDYILSYFEKKFFYKQVEK